MNSFAFLALLLTFSILCGAKDTLKSGNGLFKLKPSNEDNAVDFEIVWGLTEEVRARGKLGLAIPSAAGQYTDCSSDSDICLQWGDYAKVTLSVGSTGDCARVEWTSTYARELEDCFELEDGVHWYGGGEILWNQVYPIEKRPMRETPYMNVEQWAGVVDNYWLLSNGAMVTVDPETPLYFSLNTTHPNRVCFVARDHFPFTKRSTLKLSYEWCTGRDVKSVHQRFHGLFFQKPDAIPDEVMLIRPLWSTWAEYKTEVNQTIVLDYARRVVSEGFGNSSHIEIDDNWESCYGEMQFHPDKFPNPKEMIDEIHSMNMRVTAWAHPFVNYQCPLFKEGMDQGYFVKDTKGKTAITSWWQGSNSGLIDVTSSEATNWFSERLRKLQQDTGLDSFKFDAGEADYFPASYQFQGSEELWPQIYTTKYVEAAAKFGGLVETRAARLNQKQPIFIRMLDKSSQWGYDNGLKSMIPSLFQFSILGYPFVLPDMIGGNAYGDLPSKELFVRWMQVNIFMPSVQFSIVPWKYDQDTVNICLDVLKQRELQRERILEAAQDAVTDGSPMNRPLWWVDPEDSNTFTIDDEYMLGNEILVAPVVDEGATSRDIYLPRGRWVSGKNSSESHDGPGWLRNYPAPLDVVPFFIKMTAEN